MESIQENIYKDESEKESSSSESEEEYSYSSDDEWDPFEDIVIIATDADGIETTFENLYKASEILGISNADIIKCCKNIRGYEYITVNDKKYSFREK